MLEKALYRTKNEPIGNLGPIETYHADKNYILELPGYENPMQEKRLFELYTIGKKMV